MSVCGCVRGESGSLCEPPSGESGCVHMTFLALEHLKHIPATGPLHLLCALIGWLLLQSLLRCFLLTAAHPDAQLS